MEKIKKILLGLLLSFSGMSYSQVKYEGIKMNEVLIKEDALSNFKHGLYPINYYIKAQKVDLSSVKNSSPEELINSIQLETSIEWLNFNNYEKVDSLSSEEEEDLLYNSTENKELNFQELLQKIMFTYEGKEYCFVKFKYHFEGMEEQPLAFHLMIKENMRWYKFYDFNKAMEISLSFLAISYAKLDEVFNRTNPTDNVFMSTLLDKVYENGILSLDLLSEEINSWEPGSDKAIFFGEKLNWDE